MTKTRITGTKIKITIIHVSIFTSVASSLGGHLQPAPPDLLTLRHAVSEPVGWQRSHRRRLPRRHSEPLPQLFAESAPSPPWRQGHGRAQWRVQLGRGALWRAARRPRGPLSCRCRGGCLFACRAMCARVKSALLGCCYSAARLVRVEMYVVEMS